MARAVPFLDMRRPIGRINGAPFVPEPWFVDAWNDLVRRTGGETSDAVAAIAAVSAQNTSQIAAVAAGAVSTDFSVSPSQPLSYSVYTETTAFIVIAAHIRIENGIATSFPAGTVTNAVARGLTYYVYYEVSAPNVYLATTDVTLISGLAAQVINSIAVPSATPEFSPDFFYPPTFFG